MSEKKAFYVVDEECACASRVQAATAKGAAEAFVEEYGMEADPGFKLFVFQPGGKVETFKFTLAVVWCRA